MPKDHLSGPSFALPSFHLPDYEALSKASINLPSQAEIMFENIVERIQKFEASLPNELQAAGNIVNGPGVTFLINKVAYMEPNIILFSGLLPDGASVELVQHISQLNLLLTALPRKDDISKPRRKIGFQPVDQSENS